MENIKLQVRSWLKPETRGVVYATSAAIVTALFTFGVISSALLPLVTGVVASFITLLYATVNSDSGRNKAIYAFCGAIGALFIGLGYVGEAEIGSLLGIIAPVLGIGYAAAKTPNSNEIDTPVDKELRTV